jgi:hypothetical protein
LGAPVELELSGSGAHRAAWTQQHASRAVSGVPIGLYLLKER